MKHRDIVIPDDSHWGGYNDRFALGLFPEILLYGFRIDDANLYASTVGPLVSEYFVHWLQDYYDFNFIPNKKIQFNLIGPDGQIRGGLLPPGTPKR